MRSITWAALVVMILQPEALVGASFQMSFAAVYGLIAGYEALGPVVGRWRRNAASRWTMPLVYVAGILLTTQIAGTATAFYTIFHFNRFATYSLLGNFLAVPVVGFWVMPSALLAFCLLPFGLDGWGWQAMCWGIVCIDKIALFVSSLPGATVNLPSMPISALAVFTAGALWLCLWKTRWRLWGLAGIAAGVAIYALHQPPDLLIDPSGRLLAARAADGSLVFSDRHGGKALRESWSKQAGQGTESPAWQETEDDRLRCDAWGCVYRGPNQVFALSRRPEALADDCRKADVVATALPIIVACPSARLFIDGRSLGRLGTHALWLDADGARMETVSGWQGERPWNHAAPGVGPEEP